METKEWKVRGLDSESWVLSPADDDEPGLAMVVREDDDIVIGIFRESYREWRAAGEMPDPMIAMAHSWPEESWHQAVATLVDYAMAGETALAMLVVRTSIRQQTYQYN